MTNTNTGNAINQRVNNALLSLFEEGQEWQLTYSSYDEMAKRIQSDEDDVFTLSYPIGFRPDKTSMLGNRQYTEEELLKRISDLANEKLALNGIYQLITIIEALLGDLVRLIIIKFPKKIGNKRSIKSIDILNCNSIEDLHAKTANVILNELSYKSPKDFAEESKKFISVNLLECPSFHKYIEIKATRDIHIHNLGIVNELYIAKSSTHVRAPLDQYLPVNNTYYLESYEACLQLVEWLERELHEIWPSSEFEDRKSQKKAKELEEKNV